MQDRLLDLAYEVSRVTEEKVGVIDQVMRQTGMLAINARLEAARAGSAGNAFSIVAQEVGSVALAIRNVSSELRLAISNNVALLESAGEKLRFDMRGARLMDVARNAVEIIDRNLYERSCDVRWWATDSAVVDALSANSEASRAFAGTRLATILRSYTVYLDLWVADRNGRVVATGRPDRYAAAGADVSQSEWFRQAMRASSGDAFHVSDITRNEVLEGAPVATYATAVRRGGETHGEVIGALGIFFDWAPQAASIVGGVSLADDEREEARVMLLDANFRVIASSDRRGLLTEHYPLTLADPERGYYRHGDRLITYAGTPGYETYRGLGWYGCIDSAITPR